jgi:oligoribonuclease
MKRLLWIDLEMSGLDVEKEVIIEAAAIVTDLDFNSLETYHSVIYQPQKFIDGMDEWNTEHHSASGLIDLIPNGKDIREVEDELCALVSRYFDEPPVIAGNTIGQDRNFINKYMPKFAERLHYRMLDVSSWKMIMNHKYQIMYEKRNTHRALDDIKESIEELSHYLSYLTIPHE